MRCHHNNSWGIITYFLASRLFLDLCWKLSALNSESSRQFYFIWEMMTHVTFVIAGV